MFLNVRQQTQHPFKSLQIAAQDSAVVFCFVFILVALLSLCQIKVDELCHSKTILDENCSDLPFIACSQ